MRRPGWLAAAALAAAICSATGSAQRPTATRLEVESRDVVPVDPNDADAPRYELIRGRLHHALDPDSPYNARIVDLDLAVRDDAGLVHSSSDVHILQPVDRAARRGLLLEVCNRGGRAALRYLQYAGRDPFGDRLLMRRGLSVAWIGWQHDVPEDGRRLRLHLPKLREHSRTGSVRCDWTLFRPARRLELGHRNHAPYPVSSTDRQGAVLTWRPSRDGERAQVRREAWRFTEDGIAIEPTKPDARFESDRIYELVYTSDRPQPVGLGLAAIRDAATFFRDPNGPVAAPNVVALGISQTGRFLRHYVYQGFTTGSDGKASLDGVLALTAGAGRGSFNHRFAQPSRDAHRNSAFFYPTDIFPFTSQTQTDPLTKRSDGLFAHQFDEAHLPKIFWINTGYEYWGRSAALIHVSVDGERDIDPGPHERIYHLANCQHFPGAIGRGNPIDLLPIHRALALSMFAWVRDETTPPTSRYPRLAKGELTTVENLKLPAIPGLEAPAAAHSAYRADYGPQWSRGIISIQPPELGATYPTLVPQCDALGRELGGYWPPELHLGLGVFTSWSRHEPVGAPGTLTAEIRDFVGGFHPGQVDDDAPAARIDAVLDRAIEERFLLEEDRARLARHLQRLAAFARRSDK